MHIRNAQTNDFQQIINIYNSTIASRQVTADLQEVSLESRQNWFASHQNQANRPMLVMVDDKDTVLAWGTFSDYYPRDAYNITAEISIYVHQEHRGQQLGQRMLQHMLDMAPSLKILNVIAVIFAHNKPSVKLFEKFGFKHWGRLPQVCQLDQQLADIVLLGKRL